MTVTICNGTNWPINVCLTAGFNYDWKNQLGTNEYVELTQGAVVSLNARFWWDHNSEYDAGAAAIGTTVGGIVLGLAGVVLTIVSGGGALMVWGLAVGLGGVAMGGLGALVPEFVDTPATKKFITVADNRKYLISGRVDVVQEHGVVKAKEGQAIAIKEFTESEFTAWVRSHKPLRVPEKGSQQIGTYYATRSDLHKDGVLDTPVWIYPSLCGVPHTNPPCLDVIRGEEVHLSGTSDRPVGIVWRIEYAKEYDRDDVPGGPTADAFRLRNPESKQPNGPVALNRYVSLTSTQPDGSREVKAGQQPDDSTLFFIIKSGNCYAFVPCPRQRTYLVNENGGLTEGTKILVEPNAMDPARARWAVDRLLAPDRKLTVADLAAILDDQNFDRQQRVRILPALIGDSFVNAKSPPPLCWEIQNDSPARDTLLQLGERDVSTIDWMITAVAGVDDAFYLYCPDLRRYATYTRSYAGCSQKLIETNLIAGEEPSPFFITQSMGYLCFHPKNDPTYSVFAEDTGHGKKLKIAEWDKYPHSLARWVVLPRAPVTLVKAVVQFVGIFSDDGLYRLDIGTDAVKQLIPSTTKSWATQLVIRRVDDSGMPIKDSGPVCEEHTVGIFSEDGKWRLDIGTDSTKRNTPAATVSSTTTLIIKPERADVQSGGNYGDAIGIFSEDGQWRLDIGTDAMKRNCPAEVVSWATQLKIRRLPGIPGV